MINNPSKVKAKVEPKVLITIEGKVVKLDQNIIGKVKLMNYDREYRAFFYKMKGVTYVCAPDDDTEDPFEIGLLRYLETKELEDEEAGIKHKGSWIHLDNELYHDTICVYKWYEQTVSDRPIINEEC
jgi:hypothetical protein